MLRAGTKVSVGTSFVVAQAPGLLKDVPNAAPVNLQAHVRRCHGAHANYMTAHRAKKRVQEEEMSDEEVRSFQLIQPYFTKLQSKMPGTLAFMTRDVERRLLRTFVMLKPMVTAF